jgi:hypothetical protein
MPAGQMPGSQPSVAHAIIEAADSPRPGHLLLNSDAYRLVTEALRGRLASFEGQRDSALAADAEYGDR